MRNLHVGRDHFKGAQAEAVDVELGSLDLFLEDDAQVDLCFLQVVERYLSLTKVTYLDVTVV